MTTTTQILSILSPVRIYCVDDWMKIANASFHIAPYPIKKVEYVAEWCIELQRRYEEMTIGNMLVEKMPSILKRNEGTLIEPIFQPALLKKEMFVCEVEKPLPVHSVKYKLDSRINISREQLKAGHIREYEAAKKKVWFEGFEGGNLVGLLPRNNMSVMFYDHQTHFKFQEKTFQIVNPTVHDFVYELDRYNRTATNKIVIEPTEYFVEELLKTE